MTDQQRNRWKVEDTRRRFEIVPTFERLIELRESDKQEDRDLYAKIATGTKGLQLGFYERDKAAVEAGKED